MIDTSDIIIICIALILAQLISHAVSQKPDDKWNYSHIVDGSDTSCFGDMRLDGKGKQ